MEAYKPLLLQNIIVAEEFIENMRNNRVLPETMINDVQVSQQATHMKPPNAARNHDQMCTGKSASYSHETKVAQVFQ